MHLPNGPSVGRLGRAKFDDEVHAPLKSRIDALGRVGRYEKDAFKGL
jgi:hypothetical protein